jgi:hypothetical protein
VGDSLRERIDGGLSASRFGVVILSHSFFGKHWPTRELNGLAQREAEGRKVILPVWHGVDEKVVRGFLSPPGCVGPSFTGITGTQGPGR